jgi:prophage maintenance system killer protein
MVRLGALLFAVIMTSQAFTDGNKRVARTVYALTLLNGAVPPGANATLGARLGDM